jgi:hypothetical protein
MSNGLFIYYKPEQSIAKTEQSIAKTEQSIAKT